MIDLSTDELDEPTDDADELSDGTEDEAADEFADETADEASAEASEDEAAGAATGAARRTKSWKRFALPLLAVAVFVAGTFLWWSAATDDQIALAEARDQVLIAATSHIETMNTLDYRDVDAGLAAWRDVTAGTLNDQITQIGDDERKLLADQQKISTGSVVDAAVFSLDEDTATVIASVEVTVKDDAKPDEDPSLKRNRFSADLVKVDGQWLLESLQQVAVTLG